MSFVGYMGVFIGQVGGVHCMSVPWLAVGSLLHTAGAHRCRWTTMRVNLCISRQYAELSPHGTVLVLAGCFGVLIWTGQGNEGGQVCGQAHLQSRHRCFGRPRED
jgi:hypothetical protein